MILEPFDIVSRGTRYTFVDWQTIESEAEKDAVFAVMAASLALMQQDAMCKALGIEEVGTVGNFELGVYDGDDLVGITLIASLDYKSGPWADLIDWEVTNPNADAVFWARPLPWFPPLPLDDSLDLSTDVAHHLLSRRMMSVSGTWVTFSRLSWAIYKDRDDVNSRAEQRVHDHALADSRFTMTELPDPADASRTRVDLELQ